MVVDFPETEGTYGMERLALGAILVELPESIAGVETWGSGIATPTCRGESVKLDTRCATVTVTAPLAVVPRGVVTEKE